MTSTLSLKSQTRLLTAALLASLSLGSTGCFWGFATMGPSLGILAVPTPVSPFYQKKAEDDFWKKERYDRVPILGPVTSGGAPVAIDPPSDDEIIRALEKAQPVQGGIPFLFTRNRNDVHIVTCKIADYVDPVRVYPMIGPAQQHHAHYKCTIYYQDVKRVGWPVPHTLRDEDTQEVVYIDHNHLHMVAGDTGACSNY